jgi:hypothetical protein
MQRAISLWLGVLVILAAGLAAAAEPAAPTPTAAATPTAAVTPTAPAAVPGSLALIPKDAVGFIHIPQIAGLEADLARLAKETGLVLGKGEHPVMDQLQQRTGLKAGLDPAGDATIGFSDPKQFRDRYTVYVVPVADWDAALKETPHESMAAGLYALTSAAGPRFVARRGRYAVVTSSLRTLDALVAAETLAAGLSPELQALVAGSGPVVHLDVHRLTSIYQDDIAQWFRAASGQVYNTPEAVAYADMLSSYMLGIADFVDQIETFDGSVRFGPEGVGLDVQLHFVDGAGVMKFLSAQAPGAAPVVLPAGQPLTSSVTMHTDPKTRADLMLAATRFFLEKAPRPEPLPETTKDQVFQAMEAFAGSLGPNVSFLSAPATAGMGVAADVTILDVKDPEEFHKSLARLVAAWETLADQLNLYMKFELSPDKAELSGVPLTVYVPRFRFGIPARHQEFRERLKAIYGPEGLVYRIAMVGDKAVISSGSDLTLMRQTIERLKKGEAAETSPALDRLQKQLPRDQQITIALSLPMYVAQALQRGGTPLERIGTTDPGLEIAGLTLTAGGQGVRIASYLPHEQIRLAMDLLKRAAPEIAETPKSLFEPTKEGPPKPVAPSPTGTAAPTPTATTQPAPTTTAAPTSTPSVTPTR